MKIGLDFDGVIVDSHGLKATLLKETCGVDIPVEACRKVIQVHRGKKAYKDYCYVQRLVYETKKYHQRLEFLPGAHKRIRQLQDRGHEIVIISSRSPMSAILARQWLKAHDMDIKLIANGRNGSKAPAAQKLKLDTFIDDDLIKLVQLMGVVPALYLFRQPHNLSITNTGQNIRIVESWADIGRPFSEPPRKP